MEKVIKLSDVVHNILNKNNILRYKFFLNKNNKYYLNLISNSKLCVKLIDKSNNIINKKIKELNINDTIDDEYVISSINDDYDVDDDHYTNNNFLNINNESKDINLFDLIKNLISENENENKNENENNDKLNDKINLITNNYNKFYEKFLNKYIFSVDFNDFYYLEISTNTDYDINFNFSINLIKYLEFNEIKLNNKIIINYKSKFKIKLKKNIIYNFISDIHDIKCIIYSNNQVILIKDNNKKFKVNKNDNFYLEIISLNSKGYILIS